MGDLIMKAKEYAKRYNKELSEGRDSVDIIADILFDINVEFQNEIKRKNLKSNSSIFSLLDEFELKWRAFVKRIDYTIAEEGFKCLFCELYPDVYARWEIYKETLKDKACRVRSEEGKRTYPIARRVRRGMHLGGILK